MSTVTIPSSVTFIGKKAFYQSGLTSAIFENSNITGTNSWRLSDGVTVKPRMHEHYLNYFSQSFYDDYSFGYSDDYIVTYFCDISSSSIAAQALSDTVSIKETTEYFGAIPSKTTSTVKVNLYTVDWYVQ